MPRRQYHRATPNRSVALVEDERAVAEMYRLGLESRGFDVSVYGDGPALFEALETWLPDMLVLDWHLPSLTGGQVLERLRLEEGTRRLRVVILSNAPRGHHVDAVIARLEILAWLDKISTTPIDLADRVAHLFGDLAADTIRA